ncbi:MAG: aminotransferase class I/II-fold pyridoxal phosphate-dependent enzyme [Planctomycetota bacterium]|jgi:8-amino-7-oxononanoate synthase
MADVLDNFFKDEINRLADAGLLRRMWTVSEVSGRNIVAGGRRYLAFASNNYLGLAQDERLVEGARKAAEKYGAGSTASRLVVGNLEIHEEFERKTAAFKKKDACLLFPTGFQANVGLFPAIFGQDDIIISDSRNHASMIAGMQLSRAGIEVYPHRDVEAIESILKKLPKHRMCVIATETVFSMDGDIAPLPEIVELADRFGAITMIDEAHSTGVIGENGRGGESAFPELKKEIDIVMGTCSKALGSQGGFIAGSKNLVRYLYNVSRPFLYTTGLAPAACGATLAALDILENDPKPLAGLRTAVRACRLALEECGFPLPPHETPIIPVIIGDEETAVRIGKFLLERGMLVPVMRYPTVEKGRAMIRISVSAGHEKDDFEKLAAALLEAKERFNFENEDKVRK